MSNSLPPEGRPPRSRDREDELIAVIVAFLVFGGLLYWGVRATDGVEWAKLPDWLTTAGSTAQPPSPLALQPSPTTPAPDPQATAVPDNSLEIESPSPSPQVNPPSTRRVVPFLLPTPGSRPATTENSATQSPAPNTATTTPIDFVDVPETNWARPFILRLSALGVISGFPDRTFRPDRAVTRAEFATQIQKAFQQPDTQPAKSFKDIAEDYWATPAINKAVSTNFLSGYPEGDFRPNKLVPRLEVLVALAKGLNLPTPTNPDAVLQQYQDNAKIPRWARAKIAAATQAGLVTSYPNKNLLNPDKSATRADVASMIYQALVLRKQADPISSNYRVVPRSS